MLVFKFLDKALDLYKLCNLGTEQKVDAGFAQVNQRLDKIENCPTIKKELAEQENDNLNKNEKQKKEDSSIK